MRQSSGTHKLKKFCTFIIRKQFEIETDHKPLVLLLTSKHLRFLLRLGRYDYDILHVSGRFLYTADAQEHLAAALKIQKLVS